MSDRAFISAEYSQGFVGGEHVVLIRGGDYYPTNLTRNEIMWKVHATVDDASGARRIARLLNVDTQAAKS